MAVIALAFFAPFVGRPVFVDDHAHFDEARDLATHFSRPYSGDPRRLGWAEGRAPSEANPPVYFYLMAAAGRFWGFEVWKAHVLLLPFSVAAALLFHSLARRYLRHAFWASLLWLATPHFWLTANSLLLDALLPPMILAGVVFWIRGWERKDWRVLALGSFFLGLAPLVKYTGFLAWGAAILWTFFEGRDRASRRWIFFTIPVSMMGAWLLWTTQLYGAPHLFAVAGTVAAFPSPAAISTLVFFLFGTTPVLFLVPAALFHGKSSVSRPVPHRALFFLGGWVLWGLLGLLFARGWVCGRYFVVVGPPLVILSILFLEVRVPNLVAAPVFRGAVFIFLASFAAWMAHGDFVQASVDKKAAREADLWVQKNFSTGPAFYPAALLGGLGYYLNPDRWIPLSPDEPLPPGRPALLPSRSLPRRFLPRVDRPVAWAQFVYRGKNPIRTFDPPTGASLYGSIWGPFPFSFSTAPLEVYVVVTETSGMVHGGGNSPNL